MIRYFPASISSRMIPLNRSVLMGSRPDRGSSRISSSGSDSSRHQLDFLLIALGQLVRPLGLFPLGGAAQKPPPSRLRWGAGIEILLHLQPLCPVPDAPPGLRPGHIPQGREVQQLIHQRILGVQPPLLRQISHVAAADIQRFPVPQHLSPVPGQHIQHHADAGGFSRAVGAQQGIHPRPGHPEGQPVHHRPVPVSLGQVLYRQAHVSSSSQNNWSNVLSSARQMAMHRRMVGL